MLWELMEVHYFVSDREDISLPTEGSIKSLCLEFERKYYKIISLLEDKWFLSVAFWFQT